MASKYIPNDRPNNRIEIKCCLFVYIAEFKFLNELFFASLTQLLCEYCHKKMSKSYNVQSTFVIADTLGTSFKVRISESP